MWQTSQRRFLIWGCWIFLSWNVGLCHSQEISVDSKSSVVSTSLEFDWPEQNTPTRRRIQQEQQQQYCEIPIPYDVDKGHKEVYTVGVLAIRGFESAFAEFNATFADYLTVKAGNRFDPPIRFEMRPVSLRTVFDDIQKVDFVYVNPSAYSCIESEYDANSLVSQVSRRRVGGNVYDLKKFGGVIATLADRDDIDTITDLRDKIIATASISGLGSGQMQFKQMVDNGMNYLQDPKQLVFTSNQGLVVKGLLNGDFDVGFIRTDQLERSKDADGQPVDLSLFKVIDPQPDLNIDGVPFPFQSSTELYAEWNVAALTTVSPDVARQVQKALLDLADYATIGQALENCYNDQEQNQTIAICDSTPLWELYDGPIACSATHEVVNAALTAQKNGRYAGFTTSLSYLQLRSMQAATGFISREVETNTWRCVRSSELYEAISCPEGFDKQSRDDVYNGCENIGLSCPDEFQCVCRPCIMPVDSSCVDSIKIGSNCVSLAIFLPSFILPVLIIVGICVNYYLEYKRKQSDALWIVKPEELQFDDPPTVVGKGTFGVVFLADYRGTKVAVKRVLPNRTFFQATFDVSTKSNSGRRSHDIEMALFAKENPGLQSSAPFKVHAQSSMDMSERRIRNPKKDEELQKKLKAAFVEEIRHLTSLRHPYVTTILGAVMPSWKDEPLLIMEYMQRGSLYDVLREDSIILRPSQILEILQNIAQGLRFLHAADPQVIHGDLKSQNVLIDANFCAKVTDFGLSSKRKTGAVGTPYWMSPELLTAESQNSSASDMFAYGIIIYEIYSGRTPYEGEIYDEVIKKICDPHIRKRPPVPLHCPAKIAKLMDDCLMHDPIDRPTAEQADLILKVELKVTERTSRLEALNQQLARANQEIATASAVQLRHFACMSHEIRTPLNCIIGLSSLLEETDLNPMQQESMEMIISSGKLLRQIVDDVLDYSKLESGNAEVLVQKVNLQDTLNAVVNMIKTSRVTMDKHLKIETIYDPHLPEIIETDSRRIQQIFYNLLGNAIKFSLEKGTVEFGVHIVDRRAISFTVKDYGKGIEEKDHEKIFKPFRQTETGLTNTSGGTGLGLAITKKLVEAMGGQIAVSSVFGSWTEFKVDFPFNSRDIVNINDLSLRLRNTTVFFIAKDDAPERKHVERVLNTFRVEYMHVQQMQELRKLVETEEALVPDATYICLAHEDLYDDATYSALSSTVPFCLLTFGADFKVQRSRKHFRFLAETFPSVLVHRLGIFANEISSNPTALVMSHRTDTSEQSFDELRILIAEDNLVNQKVLSRILNRLGVTHISLANDGAEAVEMEAREPFDLVLMDMQMPKLDGIEACQELHRRQTGAHPLAKVIFVTAHVSDSFRQVCMENGAIGYLPKPCTVDSVKKVLHKAVLECDFPLTKGEAGIFRI